MNALAEYERAIKACFWLHRSSVKATPAYGQYKPPLWHISRQCSLCDVHFLYTVSCAFPFIWSESRSCFNTVTPLWLVRTTVVEPKWWRLCVWEVWVSVGDENSAFHHFDLICVSTHWGRFLSHELVSKDFPQCRTRAPSLLACLIFFFWGGGLEAVCVRKVVIGTSAHALRKWLETTCRLLFNYLEVQIVHSKKSYRFYVLIKSCLRMRMRMLQQTDQHTVCKLNLW